MYDKRELTKISLNNEHNGLYEFKVEFKVDKDEFGAGYVEEGTFFSDVKNPLIIGQEYEYNRDGWEVLLKGFLPKKELLKKIEEKKPVDIKVIEELRMQTIFLNKMSYRIGWFYYLSIISLVISIITWLYIFINSN